MKTQYTHTDPFIAFLNKDPVIGHHIVEMTAHLLGDTPPFSRVERELTAIYTSKINHCIYCVKSHSALLTALCRDGGRLAKAIVDYPEHQSALLSPVLNILRTVDHLAGRGNGDETGIIDDPEKRYTIANIYHYITYINHLLVEAKIPHDFPQAYYDMLGEGLALKGYEFLLDFIE